MATDSVIAMDDTKLRQVVAEAVALTHGNPLFIEQIKAGEQDDGPYMQSARAVRAWFLAQLMAAPETIDE